MRKEDFLKQVSKKTNVRTEDILSLANRLQSKDLKNEQNLRDLIREVANLAGRSVSKEKEDKIVEMVQKDGVPRDLESFI